MKTKQIRCYEVIANKIKKLALKKSAELGEIYTTADVIQELWNNHDNRKGTNGRAKEVSEKEENER